MKLVFIGAANPETIRIARAIEKSDKDFCIHGFIDNDKLKHGKLFYDFPVFGGIEVISEINAPDVFFVNLITSSTSARYEVTLAAVKNGAKLANFIHPSVDRTMTKIGAGNYIQEGVIIQAEVSVGDNSSIHMGSLIGHESHIGSSVFIAHGVSISGCCSIGDGCFIGTNATILPRIKIGMWSTIGAGSVVTKDVPDYSIVVGNPGKIIKQNFTAHKDGKVYT